jgi:hypothetical protein
VLPRTGLPQDHCPLLLYSVPLLRAVGLGGPTAFRTLSPRPSTPTGEFRLMSRIRSRPTFEVVMVGKPQAPGHSHCPSSLPQVPPQTLPFSPPHGLKALPDYKAMAGDAWGCLTHLPPSTYVCSPSGLGQGQSRACSRRPPHLWASPGRCGHSHGLCSCSSYPLGRETDKRGWVGNQ